MKNLSVLLSLDLRAINTCQIRQLSLIVVLLIVAVSGGVLGNLQLTQAAQIEQQHSQLKTKLEVNRQVLAAMPDESRQRERLEAVLRGLNMQLVSTTELETVLMQVSEYIVKTGLQIKLFQPMPDRQIGLYRVLPISIQIDGQFQQVLKLFHEMATFPRLFKIDELNISAESDHAIDLLHIAMVVQLYRSENS